MAQLVKIIETPEAITAEASAYVWEEYDAPRKRVKRARIVEHRFTVSIPKHTEEAAPVAFVVEHFPEAFVNLKNGAHEYRPGYDQPVRYAGGKFYTPARFVRSGKPSAWNSSDPRERIAAHVNNTSGVSERTISEYAEAIARDEIRADQYPATMDRADRVEDETGYFTHNLAVIAGEVWEECGEPFYEYYSSWFGRDQSRHIFVETSKNPRTRNHYGATDRAALAYYHADVERLGYIRVLRPDLVTIDRKAEDLAEDADRAARNLQDARDHIKELQNQLKDARAHLAETKEADAKARMNLAAYEADPRAWWSEKAAEIEEDADPAKPFSARRIRAAAAVRRELAKEA